MGSIQSFSSWSYSENGLDPETCLHLISIYGLEVILPESAGLHALELCHKKLLERILPLPKITPDPAVHILSGFTVYERSGKICFGL